MNRVLIVDDDPNILDLAAGLFEYNDWQIRVAVTGEQALRLVDEERPHLIILDLGLPGIDGIEVLASLRKKGKQIPIIIITGSMDVSRMLAAMKFGIAQYLVKPGILDGLEKAAVDYRA